MPDVVVVGAGPNGLAAAITCAEAGRSVVVLEATERIGGGCRSAELTLPGFVHDVCSAIHPLAAVSPFFQRRRPRPPRARAVGARGRSRPPARRRPGRGPPTARSTPRSTGLGDDGAAWDQNIGWVARRWDDLAPAILGPLLRVPRHPLTLAGFGAAWPPPDHRRRTAVPHRRGPRPAGGLRGALLPPARRARSPPPWPSRSSRPSTSPAGPSRAAARSRSSTPWRHAWTSSAPPSRPAGRCARWPTCPMPGPSSSTSPPGS